MSSNFIPIKIKSILDLIRFDRPIGFALLMWPCWFALAAININIFNNLKWYFLFFIGSFLMRSCGCIVNDLVDIRSYSLETDSLEKIFIKAVKEKS